MSLTRDDVRELRLLALDKQTEAADALEVAEASELASLATMRQTGDAKAAAGFEELAADARRLAAVKADLADHAADTADRAEDALDQTVGFGPEDPRWEAFWAGHQEDGCDAEG
jgi:hypothetical protein